MGCDIHVHIEVKIQGKWHHYSHPSWPRDYEFFGYIAGVRRPKLQQFPRKELPKDMTFLTRHNLEYWESDAHSKSWLTGEELQQALNWLEKEYEGRHEHSWYANYNHIIYGYLFGNGYDSKTNVEDCRCIFWFDN